MAERFGISLGAPENLVRVSKAFHQKLHTSAYYNYLRNHMSELGDREALLQFLRDLRVRLTAADEHFQKTGEMPDWSGE